ncbi:hypothetical protein BJY01DRAFT_229559 [Aspergillus pseudoustus]|uniref:Ricin B lectin domain-containing protein n=1 Tax=Aspergillus pseudoustus TaxID=1810923 RepID=A0ABR4IG66_9EURO
MQHIDPMPHSLADSDEDEICYTPSAATRTSSAEAHTHLHSPFDPPPNYAITSSSAASAPTSAVAPHPNATFIIRDRSTGLVIALKDGELGLHPDEKSPSSGGHITSYEHQHGRGSHWHCVENEDFWLGFRSSVSKQYIGHNNKKENNKWRFIAKADQHRGWEYFCAREHPEGGHVLLVKHYDGFRAMKVGGKDGRELLVVDRKEGGTPFDFIKIR